MKALFSFFGLSLISFFRILFVGFLSTIFVIYNVDAFTDPSYGTDTLVIIVAAFSFFPTFCVVFVERYVYGKRKTAKQLKKKKLPNYDL